MKNEKDIYTHGSIEEYRNDGDPFDRAYMPGRSVCHGLNRRRNSLVVLPDNSSVRQNSTQFNQIVSELGLETPETLFVPDDHYLLDNSILDHLHLLEKRLGEEGSVVRPYANTPDLRQWVDELRNRGHKVNVRLPRRVYYEDLKSPQHRGGWGRNVVRPNEESFPERYGISYPVSYIGANEDQLVEAYERIVDETGNSGVYFKPVFSAGGFTIQKVTSIEEVRQRYQNAVSAGNLVLFNQEMPVEMQAEIQGIQAFASVQYNENGITTPGGVSMQIVDGNQWGGNEFNTAECRQISTQSRKLFGRFQSGYQQESKDKRMGGGLDLAVTRSETGLDVCVVEHNGGRVVGADPAIALAKAFGVSDKPFLIRKTADPNCDLITFWNALKSEKLAFGPNTQNGAFPLVWMDGSGFLFVVGDNEHQMREITDKALHVVAKNGYVK